MSGLVGGLIVIALIIVAIGLITDVVGTLFGAKKSSASTPKSAWNARTFGKAQVEHAKKEYTFEGLPYSVKNHHSFYSLRRSRHERSQYEYYNPAASMVATRARISWKLRSSNYVDREYAPHNLIDQSELFAFRSVANFPLIKRLEQDIAECLAGLGAYPVTEPHAVGEVPSPPKPNLLDDAIRLLPIDILASLSSREKEYVQGFIESQNLKRKAAYESAKSKHKKALNETESALQTQLTHWQSACQEWDKACTADVEQLEALKAKVCSEFSVEQVAKLALSSAAFPNWFPRDLNIAYDAEGQILIVEHRLPNLDEIEWVKLFVLKNSRPLKPLTATERKKVFAEFYPLVTLSLAVLLAKHFDAEKVALIAVNGWVEFRSKATGLEKRAFCSSLAASTDKLKEIDLQHADPLTAYHVLKGVTTPSLELAPVAPKLRLDMEDKRFVEARDVLQGMDSDENLASMDWEDFEHLCRELFEKVFASEGATVSVTQASRDQGVDAVILDPDPIRGGKIVIQAKRYVNTVDVSAVRDLWGVVSHEGAMKGLLVTTSQFGPDSYAFAQGKPLTLINGSELLHLLEKNGYTFRINLEEARQMQRESGMPPFRKKR